MIHSIIITIVTNCLTPYCLSLTALFPHLSSLLLFGREALMRLNWMRWEKLIFKPLVLYNTHRAQNTAQLCLPRGTVVVVYLYLFVKVTHSSECFTVLLTVRWEVKNKQSLLTSRYKIKQRKSNVLFRDELSSLSHLTGHQCFIFTDVTFEEGAESGSEICGSQSVSLLY